MEIRVKTFSGIYIDEECYQTRITTPDITNIHVAFTVGNEPQLKTDTEDEGELNLLKILKGVYKDNKLRFQNKREVRSWLSETEVCEYWYRSESTGFWRKMWKKIAALAGINVQPAYKLRMQIWSPFRGDRLYPIFSDNGQDYFILEGDIANGGAQNIGKSHLLKIQNGGKAYYLDWHQTSDMVKTQIDNLLVRCYSLTNTPLISFDQLRGTGQFPSGTAFDFMFMATLFAVERHWEDMGEFFQRRANFLISAIGSLVPSMKQASETLDVEVVQCPYRIDDLSKRISDAVNGVDGGVMSQKQGVMLVGIADDFQSELEEIEADKQKAAQMQDVFNAAE